MGPLGGVQISPQFSFSDFHFSLGLCPRQAFRVLDRGRGDLAPPHSCWPLAGLPGPKIGQWFSTADWLFSTFRWLVVATGRVVAMAEGATDHDRTASTTPVWPPRTVIAQVTPSRVMPFLHK